eukprot:6663240-Prymnesium_polylepis.1
MRTEEAKPDADEITEFIDCLSTSTRLMAPAGSARIVGTDVYRSRWYSCKRTCTCDMHHENCVHSGPATAQTSFVDIVAVTCARSQLSYSFSRRLSDVST